MSENHGGRNRNRTYDLAHVRNVLSEEKLSNLFAEFLRNSELSGRASRIAAVQRPARCAAVSRPVFTEDFKWSGRGGGASPTKIMMPSPPGFVVMSMSKSGFQLLMDQMLPA
jgi:hypothetical protein